MDQQEPQIKQKAVRSQGERVKEQSARKRIPLGVPQQKLGVATTIEGYHLHWINDTPGRLHAAVNGGYEYVTPEEVGQESDDGSRVRRLVGRDEDGSALHAYLMKIRQDWYDEDQRAGQAQVDSFDAAISAGKLERVDNSYSSIKTWQSNKF